MSDDYLQSPESERLQVVGGCLLNLSYLVVPILILLAIFKGMDAIANVVAPIIVFVTGIVLFIDLPLSLLLAIPRKTRGIASIGILVASFAFGLWLWLTSLIVAFSTVSFFWIVVGILFAGIGIVPVGIIGALIAGKWGIAGILLLGLIVTFATRMFAFFLAERSGPKFEYVPSPPNPPTDYNDVIYPR